MDPHILLRQVIEQGKGPFQRGPWGALLDLRTLAAEREIILIADLHARRDNLHAILSHQDSRGLSVRQRVEQEESLLIFLGDMVHQDPYFSGHGSSAEMQARLRDMSGSVAIMQEILDLKRVFPGRVYCLLGNHDYISGRFAKGGVSQGIAYRNALERQFGAAYVSSYELFLRQCPVAMAANGLLAAHAGPARTARSLDEIAGLDPLAEENPLLEDLQWGRFGSTYTTRDVRRFLKMARQPRAYLVVGHSPAFIPYGDFKTEVCPRHYILYSAGDYFGYAVFKNATLDFIARGSSPGSANGEQ